MSEFHYDAVLVGAGVMSATLAALLKELDPTLSIAVLERFDTPASESSDAWNNAGTGHAALCELNYTPEKADGSIDVTKALQINESFEVSKQFWAYLVEKGVLPKPEAFINPVPHSSFVRGEENAAYLRKRHAALSAHPLFHGMEYSEDPAKLAEWMPLILDGRDPGEKIAATRTAAGTDVNFGALTRTLLKGLQKQGVTVYIRHDVKGLKRDKQRGGWRLAVQDLDYHTVHKIHAKFVFLGAGGGALPLLQKSGIAEGKGFGGFPVSGQWLVCTNPDLVSRHGAKVYGKASVGAPPMSVPHLDTRVIDGKRALLFGPYAGFSTRFLKRGSLLDLFASLKPDNIWPMIRAGLDNLDLTKYLIGQVLQSQDDRLEALRGFVPRARKEDWKLEVAGQRVQVIKKDAKKGGVLQFGTELVCAGDGTLAALLGASPGASTAVSVMLDIVKKCFPAHQARLAEIIPSYGKSLAQDAALLQTVRERTNRVLKLAA
ncbi:MAG: malate:quinone oxidoreductase [Verrucomicrobium sp.]|nr:malate:quinone oxidoreductase [Verrucomicrobium sp.]